MYYPEQEDRKTTTAFARQLRRQMTSAERILWKELRAKRFERSKFRRQAPIGPYIADFFCFQHRLIIEVDGGIHDNRQEQDRNREQYLQELRYRILRFTNTQVQDSLSSVLQSIEDAIHGNAAPLSPQPSTHIPSPHKTSKQQ